MRNFFIIVGVLLGTVILAFVGMGLFLMLAPGTRLFGVQYVKATNTASVDDVRRVEEIPTGNIIIESYGVPTNIEYTTNGFFEFHFVQKFNGFTKTNAEKPSLSVYTDDNGNLIVKTNEFVPFIWGNNNNGYVLDCKIPASFLDRSIKITSTKSKVVVNTDNYATAEISEMSISTKGAVSFAGRLDFQTLKVNSAKKKIVLPETMAINNLEISSGNKSVTVKSEVSGKIAFKSNKGSLLFNKCAELLVETKRGSIEGREDGTCVSGNAKITTTTGKVVLQHVGGDLSVKTTNGRVYIGQNLDCSVKGVTGKTTIETTKGNVYLVGTYGSDDKIVKVTTKSGDVIVGNNQRPKNEKEEVPLSTIAVIEINTSKGRVEIESATKVAATTSSGNVVVGSFKEATITTSSGDVDVTASDTAIYCKLNIKTGKSGNVTAKNISNESTIINAKGSVYASFRAVMGKIDINGKDKNVTVILPDSINTNSIIWVDSENGDSLIRVNQIYRNAKSYHSKETVSIDEQDRLIKVTSGKGKITLIHNRYA